MTGAGDPAADPRWYVVRTLPRMEATAEAHLMRQAFDVFLPRARTTRRHARRVETVRAPLFPGYGFVRLDLARQRWSPVNGTIGVASLVMVRDRPAPVPPGIVEGLLAAVNEDGVIDLDHDYRPGDPVRLVSGPFAGELGVLLRLDRHGRVEMLLSLVNGRVRLKVTRDSLEPVR
jgi:transcriptional antiterminator RfaH